MINHKKFRFIFIFLIMVLCGTSSLTLSHAQKHSFDDSFTVVLDGLTVDDENIGSAECSMSFSGDILSCESQEFQASKEFIGSESSNSSRSSGECALSDCFSLTDKHEVELEGAQDISIGSISRLVKEILIAVEAMKEKLDAGVAKRRTACESCTGSGSARVVKSITVTVTPKDLKDKGCKLVGDDKVFSYDKRGEGDNCKEAEADCGDHLASVMDKDIESVCGDDCGATVEFDPYINCAEYVDDDGDKKALAICTAEGKITCTQEPKGWFSIQVEIKVDGWACVSCRGGLSDLILDEEEEELIGSQKFNNTLNSNNTRNR